MLKRKQVVSGDIEEKIRRLQAEIVELQDSSAEALDSKGSGHEDSNGVSEDGEKIGLDESGRPDTSFICNDADGDRDEENSALSTGKDAPSVDVTEKNVQILASQSQMQTDKEKELGEEILQVLGEDPSASKALDFYLHSSIASRWKHWVEKGMKQEEKQKLFEKYPRKEGFVAPELNQVIAAAMSKSSVRRDRYTTNCQEATGSALMALGAAVSTLLDKPESIDKLALLENLNDAAKLITDTHFQLNESRKALILPGVSKPLKDLLEKTKSDTELFGKNLSKKIKAMEALEKMRQSVKYTDNLKTSNRKNRQTTDSHSNFRSPQEKRTFSSHPGYSRANVQDRQRLPFRGQQQVYNNKATTQRQRHPRR